MESVALGPLNISIQLLLLIISMFVGYLLFRWRLRLIQHTEEIAIGNFIVNTFMLGLFIWKFSPLVLDFRLVILDPLSLLYLNGGTNGIWLAAIYACIVLAIQTWRMRLTFFFFPDLLFTWYLASLGMYRLFQFLFMEEGFLAAGISLLSLAIVFIQIKHTKRYSISIHDLVIALLWFSIGRTLCTLLIVNSETMSAGRGYEQMFFSGLACLSFVIKIWLEERAKRS